MKLAIKVKKKRIPYFIAEIASKVVNPEKQDYDAWMDEMVGQRNNNPTQGYLEIGRQYTEDRNLEYVDIESSDFEFEKDDDEINF